MDGLVICKADAERSGMAFMLIHQSTFFPRDAQIHLEEVQCINVVFIVTFPPMRDIGGMQSVASTSTLSPFPDMGTRTWEGTLLTYGSGRVVCTGHRTVHDAIVNINALARAFSKELNQPIDMLQGKLINLVASGRITFPVNKIKLREQKVARFTNSFDGTSFNARRSDNAKDLRLSMFQSGRFNVPGLTNLNEARIALMQTVGVLQRCKEENATSVPSTPHGRNTTRKRRKIRHL